MSSRIQGLTVDPSGPLIPVECFSLSSTNTQNNADDEAATKYLSLKIWYLDILARLRAALKTIKELKNNICYVQNCLHALAETNKRLEKKNYSLKHQIQKLEEENQQLRDQAKSNSNKLQERTGGVVIYKFGSTKKTFSG